jgi:hypothetical protein
MRHTHVIAVLALTLSAAVLPVISTSASTSAEQHRPSASGRDAAADRALHQADAVLDGVGRGEQDATLALRDLARALPSLGPAERQRARALLARPTSPHDQFGDSYRAPSKRTCSTRICVHWVSRTSDAPRSRAWVTRTMDVMKKTWGREVAELGYQPPVRDARRGGNGKFDVYLKDIGGSGLFGYCAPEFRTKDSRWRASGYCVLDDDFARSQFHQRPIVSLKATAAHEFFHAIQFGYDYAEDAWFMEATATWMEERVFDSVDDNRRYLRDGQLGRPQLPLDIFEDFGLAHYGNWVFFEYLSHRFDNTVVRTAWDRAAAVGAKRGRYSIRAVENAVESAGAAPFPAVFRDYSASNTVPSAFSAFYPEGGQWPAAPARTRELTSTDPVRSSFRINHLASRSLQVVPGDAFGPGSRLVVRVDAPDSPASDRRPVASVVVRSDDGNFTLEPIVLDDTGDGILTVPFDRRVTITLANASTSFSCWEGMAYSCRGFALHDAQRFRYEVTALTG